MERIGVVGSRKNADIPGVLEFIRRLWDAQPDSIVVSGGAIGVDETAEDEWFRLGGQVISFRPFQTDAGSYGVEEWRFGPRENEILRHVVPTFADYTSALFFRSSMIVEIADRLVSFTNPAYSPGTKFTKYIAHEIPSYEMVA